MIVGWIVVIIFFIMSVILLSGKGAFLIAGYNTKSKEEKEQYDEKKLCRAMGVTLFLITIATAFLNIVNTNSFAVLYAIFIIVLVIANAIYTNARCKRK